MIEPLIRWLNASHKGYDMTSCGLRPASKWYANDGTLITNIIQDMVTLLDIVELFNDWSRIRLNVGKCKITAYIKGLQSFRKKSDRDDALRARLAHITLGGQRIGSSHMMNPSRENIWAQTLRHHYARTPTSDEQSSNWRPFAKRSTEHRSRRTENNASYYTGRTPT
jgi:hypothetical protein